MKAGYNPQPTSYNINQQQKSRSAIIVFLCTQYIYKNKTCNHPEPSSLLKYQVALKLLNHQLKKLLVKLDFTSFELDTKQNILNNYIEPSVQLQSHYH
jgi:hypothetical protein